MLPLKYAYSHCIELPLTPYYANIGCTMASGSGRLAVDALRPLGCGWGLCGPDSRPTNARLDWMSFVSFKPFLSGILQQGE